MNSQEIIHILTENGIGWKWEINTLHNKQVEIQAGETNQPGEEASQLYKRVEAIFKQYKSGARDLSYAVSMNYGKVFVYPTTTTLELFTKAQLDAAPTSWVSSLPEAVRGDMLIELTERQLDLLAEYQYNTQLDPGSLVRVKRPRSIKVMGKVTEDLVSTVLSGVDRNRNSDGTPEAIGELNLFLNLQKKIETVLDANGLQIDEWGDPVIIPKGQPRTTFRF